MHRSSPAAQWLVIPTRTCTHVVKYSLFLLTAVSSGQAVVDDAERIAAAATQPLCYVLSFDAGNKKNLLRRLHSLIIQIS